MRGGVLPKERRCISSRRTDRVDGAVKTRKGNRMSMPKIKIERYETTGGTEKAPPVGKEWAGYIEPEDRSWILYIRQDGTPFFFAHRDPETGACIEPPISVPVNGQTLVSAHAIGADVYVLAPDVTGNIAAVTFTDYGKVLYDVHVEITDPPVAGTTTLHQIDSCFVHAAPPVLNVGIREQIDTNVPGKPWVAHQSYTLPNGTTGSRRVAFGATEEEARTLGGINAFRFPVGTDVPHPAEIGE